MEARGLEPLSEGASIKASTGLSLILHLTCFTPEGWIKAGQLCEFLLQCQSNTAGRSRNYDTLDPSSRAPPGRARCVLIKQRMRIRYWRLYLRFRIYESESSTCSFYLCYLRRNQTPPYIFIKEL